LTAAHWALLISGLALAISIASFIWSIWKEFIYVKPKVQVGFSIMRFFGVPTQAEQICSLTATNMGPGPVVMRQDRWMTLDRIEKPDLRFQHLRRKSSLPFHALVHVPRGRRRRRGSASTASRPEGLRKRRPGGRRLDWRRGCERYARSSSGCSHRHPRRR
jgi:hypothetical protein